MRAYVAAGHEDRRSTSSVREVGDRTYVVIRSAGGILAVFSLRDGCMLERLHKRWPAGL
jgi:hypothetical protein